MSTQAAAYPRQGLARCSGVAPSAEARSHASRSTLSSALAELLDPTPVLAVDLEGFRALLDVATPSDELARAWRDVQAAINAFDAKDFGVPVAASCAADLRCLARLSDRASLAVVGGDTAEHERLLGMHADFLVERGLRLANIAAELCKDATRPQSDLGRAIERILQELRSTVAWHRAA